MEEGIKLLDYSMRVGGEDSFYSAIWSKRKGMKFHDYHDYSTRVVTRREYSFRLQYGWVTRRECNLQDYCNWLATGQENLLYYLTQATQSMIIIIIIIMYIWRSLKGDILI